MSFPKYSLSVLNKYSNNNIIIFLSVIGERDKLIFEERQVEHDDVKSVCFHPLPNSRTLPSYHVMVSFAVGWSESEGTKGKRKKVP